MQPLSARFGVLLPELQGKLDVCRSAQDTVRVATSALTEFLSSAVMENDQITAHEERLLNEFFAVVIDSLRSIAKSEAFEFPRAIAPEVSADSKLSARDGDWRSTAAGVLTAAVGAAVVPTVGLGVAAGAVGGFAVAKVVGRLTEKSDSVPEPVQTRKFGVRIESGVVIDCLRQSVKRFDDIIKEVGDIDRQARTAELNRPVDIRELPNVVDFMHVILEAKLGDASLSQEFRNYLDIVERIFSSYGIRVVHYKDRTDDSQFVIQDRSTAITEPVTVRPALVADNVVVARGYVALPA
ncbi:hypothetical protein ABXN37_28650 [Piscinibacter sakaiensis]|uniref:hypothetical protein n=1 Tax=Piscinibacter sakaiensis TaxID=1547922 RepID=UPI0012F77C33|nr:hypothetical protein [Piscinibacter sakaiensis]